MPEDESLQAARAMRRAILGDAYVEAQVAGANTTAVEFQDFITSMAWAPGPGVAHCPPVIGVCSSSS
jgi:hypothetical protein